MTVSWLPVIVGDMVGSTFVLILAVCCSWLSWRWTKQKNENIFRHYVFLLTLSVVFFAISRSVGHLAKQILLLSGMSSLWQVISPFSGAINTATFVVIFAFSIYFYRLRKVHLLMEKHRNHLEEIVRSRTEALVAANASLQEEIGERIKTEQALQATLEKVKTLSGFLPICASCKKIRDDRGYWNQIEAYISQHSDAEFSHGICPDCAKKLYPEFYGQGDPSPEN